MDVLAKAKSPLRLRQVAVLVRQHINTEHAYRIATRWLTKTKQPVPADLDRLVDVGVRLIVGASLQSLKKSGCVERLPHPNGGRADGTYRTTGGSVPNKKRPKNSFPLAYIRDEGRTTRKP